MAADSKNSRRLAYGAGLALTLTGLGLLLLPGKERLAAPGPMMAGHAKVGCAECHTPAPGSARQQIQASVAHALSRREHGADFLHQPVNNDHCLACHRNPADAHPAYRFNEPRFAAARQAIAPQQCVSCHAEHRAQRVTVEPLFCRHCHQDMDAKNDPIRPTHRELAQAGRWSDCLRCHDYHKNHTSPTPRELPARTTPDAVLRYFDGGPSPYGDVRHPAQLQKGPAR